MPMPLWWGHINKRVFNPWALRGKRWQSVGHVGRSSGKAYRTPVEAMRVDDGFIVTLVYGSRSDWVQNVLAAGERHHRVRRCHRSRRRAGGDHRRAGVRTVAGRHQAPAEAAEDRRVSPPAPGLAPAGSMMSVDRGRVVGDPRTTTGLPRWIRHGVDRRRGRGCRRPHAAWNSHRHRGVAHPAANRCRSVGIRRNEQIRVRPEVPTTRSRVVCRCSWTRARRDRHAVPVRQRACHLHRHIDPRLPSNCGVVHHPR
jgi:deazaflavin-dependent oxidoreductase (nitroreductase family)